MKILAVTLARGGSKGIPNKNMYKLDDRPLLWYTINEVKKSSLITDYYISSDSNDILNYAELQNCKTIKRPDNLASDTATSADALMHALVESSEKFTRKHHKYDILVEIMATNPLKTVEDIDNVIQMLIDDKRADSVVSVVRVWDHHPSRIKYIEDDLLKPFFPEVAESRRQDLTPPAYIRNGSIYATTVDSFLSTQKRLGPVTKAYVMSEDHTINIDRMMDMRVAEMIIKERDKEDIISSVSGKNIYL